LSDLEDGSLTASELASEFVHALIILAGEAGIDAGDAATLAALDLIVRLAVYGRAPLQVVLDTIAAAAERRQADRDCPRRLPATLMLRREIVCVMAFHAWGGVGKDGVVGDQTWAVSLHAASAILKQRWAYSSWSVHPTRKRRETLGNRRSCSKSGLKDLLVVPF
jgi:hypothetical protein